MDFTRQCKRFLNYKVFASKQFDGKIFSNISALSVLRTGTAANGAYRIVFADNDLKCLCLINEIDGKLLKEVNFLKRPFIREFHLRFLDANFNRFQSYIQLMAYAVRQKCHRITSTCRTMTMVLFTNTTKI